MREEMKITVFLSFVFLVCVINQATSKSVVAGRNEKKSQADIDKEVLLEDPDDYPDDDVLDLPPDEQKVRLRILVERKIDANKDGFVDGDELYEWTLKAYDRFEVDDIRDEIQIVDEDKDGAISWKEHVGDVYGAECAEKPADANCFPDPQTDEEKANSINFNKDKDLFAKADVNGDGSLDFAEFVIFKHPRRSEATQRVVIESKLAILDQNGDGKLSMEEFLAETKGQTTDEKTHEIEEERFKEELDTDGNGFLDDAEILNWLEPNNVAEAQDESDHLMSECDSDDNKKLSVDEILENHSIWVDSDATDYGRYLMDHDEL